MAINKKSFLDRIKSGVDKHTPIGVAKSAYKLVKEKTSADISQIKAYHGKRKVKKMLRSKLPGRGTIGRVSQKETGKKISSYVNVNNYKMARKYTKAQLGQMLKQAKGTAAEAELQKRFDNMNK